GTARCHRCTTRALGSSPGHIPAARGCTARAAAATARVHTEVPDRGYHSGRSPRLRRGALVAGTDPRGPPPVFPFGPRWALQPRAACYRLTPESAAISSATRAAARPSTGPHSAATNRCLAAASRERSRTYAATCVT